MHLTFESTKYQKGISMIETLIAAFVFSIGVLTVTALQLKGLTQLTNSNSMATAMLGASDMADRMRANPMGMKTGAYDSLFAKDIADPGCGNTCSYADQAKLDAFKAFEQLSGELPDSSLRITNGGGGLFTVDVIWLERNGVKQDIQRHRFSFRPYNP